MARFIYSKLLLALPILATLGCGGAFEQNQNPVGVWQLLDDKGALAEALQLIPGDLHFVYQHRKPDGGYDLSYGTWDAKPPFLHLNISTKDDAQRTSMPFYRSGDSLGLGVFLRAEEHAGVTGNWTFSTYNKVTRGQETINLDATQTLQLRGDGTYGMRSETSDGSYKGSRVVSQQSGTYAPQPVVAPAVATAQYRLTPATPSASPWSLFSLDDHALVPAVFQRAR